VKKISFSGYFFLSKTNQPVLLFSGTLQEDIALMICNIINNTFYIWKNNELSILKFLDAFNFLIQDYKDPIFLNYIPENIDIQKDNLVDMRILNWISNNLSDYYDLTRVENLKEIRNFIKLQLENIDVKKEYILKAMEYTNYYRKLNSLFKFKYNVSAYNCIKEKYTLELDIKQKISNYQVDPFYETVGMIEHGIRYSFLNSTGMITPNNALLQKIDRKKHIELFKTDKDKKYYLIDFKNFEVVPLYFYTKNIIYSDKSFYDVQSKAFNLQRNEFKDFFLMYLNGAGKEKLGKNYDLFRNYFRDLEELKMKLQNENLYTNLFKMRLGYEKKYSVLGHLCQSTSYSFLIRFYSRCYDNFINSNKIKFCWNLYDEFFVECDKDFKLSELFDSVKFYNYRIEEY